MRGYSKERKEAVLQKMMPPINKPVAEISEETGISAVTLYKWRREAKEGGIAVPGNGKNSERWSAEDKFAIVLETAPMNEAELAEYCRKKGLFSEQILAWKKACIQGNALKQSQQHDSEKSSQKDKKRIKALERELRRKERALAETAALLVLRKKANAIWGEEEDE